MNGKKLRAGQVPIPTCRGRYSRVSGLIPCESRICLPLERYDSFKVCTALIIINDCEIWNLKAKEERRIYENRDNTRGGSLKSIENYSIWEYIVKRWMKFVGHVMRYEELLKIIIEAHGIGVGRVILPSC